MPPHSIASRHAALSVLFSIVLAACGGGGGGTGGETPPPPPPPPTSSGDATATGNAAGTAVSQTIGTAGGRMVLEGGRVTLDVPAGALAQDTVITAQPITNQAHGGTGQAWRFGPANVQFTKPATLAFGYADGDVKGSAPEALGMAYQHANGTWEWVKSPVLDTAARKVRVNTSHFSDWSLVLNARVRPTEATVTAGQTLALNVVHCYFKFNEDPEDPVPGYACDDNAPAPVKGKVIEWAVNGKPGGGAATGTITGDQKDATFTAPANKPTPETVTASARVNLPGGGQALLLSHITIVEAADYTGPVEFELVPWGGVLNGTANVAWKKVEAMSQGQNQIRFYAPSGTSQLDLRLEGCDPQQASLPIDGSFATNQAMGAPFLLVNERQKVYQFTLRHTGAVTLQCGEPREPFELRGEVIAITVGFAGAGSCQNMLEPFPFTDARDLAGHGVCPDEFKAAWRFRAPQ